MPASFRDVLDAVDPTHALRSAQQLFRLIDEPIDPLSLRRLMHRALAFRMRQGPIKHVFVLMLENRSFDHIFGYSGIAGTDAETDQETEVDGLTPRRDGTGQDGMNANPATGEVIRTSPTAPFSLVGVASDVEHEFLDVLTQLYGPDRVPRGGVLPGGADPPIDDTGRTGFVANFVARDPRAPPETPMRCFDPANLPVLNTLAREFVICDRWFASHPGPTWPNRFFVHAASPSTDGQVDSPPNARIAAAFVPGLPFVGRLGPGKFHFRNGTIYDRLAARNLTYRIYSGNNCPQINGLRANRGEFDPVNLGSLAHDLAQP